MGAPNLPTSRSDRDSPARLDADADRLRREPDGGFEWRVTRAVTARRRLWAAPKPRRAGVWGRFAGSRLAVAAGLTLAASTVLIVMLTRPGAPAPSAPAPPLVSVEALERDLDLWFESLPVIGGLASLDEDPTRLIETLEAALNEPLTQRVIGLEEESL